MKYINIVEDEMIINAEIINQPYSGQYIERVYDISSPWNSQDWTWVKFLNDDYTEWCGEFRGSPRSVAISTKYNIVLILTSDYLFLIDRISTELMEYDHQPQYHNLTVTPSGDFILADYYNLYIVKSSLKDMKTLESPIKMDFIKLGNWSENRLLITCDELLNWENHLELEFNCETLKITIITSSRNLRLINHL